MRQTTEGASGDAANIPAANFETQGAAVCHSGVKFDADGDVYAKTNTGLWQRVGTWLLNGTNSDFFLSHGTEVGTTLTTDGGGSGGTGIVLSTDRIYDIQNVSPSTEEQSLIAFEISDDASQTLVYSSRTYTLFASTDVD